MSPSFINENSHPVRVTRPSELAGGASELVRIVPGQIIEADGAFADALEGTRGVNKASSEDENTYEAELERRQNEHAGPAPGLDAKLAIGPARIAVRAAVAAPLRRVVGDDAAPHGPASGTVTTKAEAARVDNVEREAFAQHERLPEETIPGVDLEALPAALGAFDHTSSQVETAQAINAELAEEAAQEYIEGQGSGGVQAKTSGEALAEQRDEDDVETGPTEPTEPEQAEGEEPEGEPQLEDYTVPELQLIADEKGLPRSGNKTQLIARIRESE